MVMRSTCVAGSTDIGDRFVQFKSQSALTKVFSTFCIFISIEVFSYSASCCAVRTAVCLRASEISLASNGQRCSQSELTRWFDSICRCWDSYGVRDIDTAVTGCGGGSGGNVARTRLREVTLLLRRSAVDSS